MKKFIKIVNGPSREELFDGLRLYSEKRLIPFIIKKDDVERWTAVVITSIQAEDGNGQSWNLTFSINQKYLLDDFFVEVKKVEPHVIAKKVDFSYFRQLCEENYLVGEFRKDVVTVKAYYSTKTREGTITVLNDESTKCMHRIVIHNGIADDNTVKNIVKKEIGAINILNWEVERVIHYKSFVSNSGFQQPQREIIIRVFYSK